MHYILQIKNKTYSRLKNTSSQRETRKLLNSRINPPVSKATSTCLFNKKQPSTLSKLRNVAFILETFSIQGV